MQARARVWARRGFDVSALTAHNREGRAANAYALEAVGDRGPSVRPSIPSKSSPMDVLPMLVLLP